MLHTLSCQLLNANPLVAVADAFIDAGECAHLIALTQGRLERSAVLGDDADANVTSDRTNSECLLAAKDDPAIAPLLQRLSDIVTVPVSHCEGLTVLHYGPGQEFKLHADGIWSGVAPDAIEAFEADGGQRLFTTMIYLNSVADGGGTTFSLLGLRIKPEIGRLLLFANTPAGNRDQSRQAAHAGEPVVDGEKWVAVTWWRERPVPDR